MPIKPKLLSHRMQNYGTELFNSSVNFALAILGRRRSDHTLSGSPANMPLTSGRDALPEARRGEREAAQQRLIKRAKMMDNLHEAVIVVDAEDVVTFWGRGAEALYRRSGEEALGRKAADLGHALNDDDGETRRTRALEEGIWRGELHQELSNGSTIWVDSMIVAVRLGTDPVHAFLQIDRAIEERKLAEKAHKLLSQRLDVLQRIDRAIRRAQSPDSIGQFVVQSLLELVQCQAVLFYNVDLEENSAYLVTTAAVDALPKNDRLTAFRLAGTPWLESLKLGEICVESIPRFWDMTAHSPDNVNERILVDIPMLAEEKLVGLLRLVDVSDDVLSGETLEISQEIADSFSNSLYQFRLTNRLRLSAGELQKRFEELQRVQEEECHHRYLAEALGEIAISLGSTLNRDELLELLFARLGQYVRCESAAIVLGTSAVPEHLFEYLYTDQDSESPAQVRPMPIRAWLPLESEVIRARHPMVVEGSDVDKRGCPVPAGMSIRSCCTVPLLVHDSVIGVLTIMHSRSDFFDASDIRFVGALAAQASVAIENARYYEESKRQNEELATLYDASVAISGLLDFKELLSTIYRHISMLTDIDGFSLLRFCAETNDIEILHMVENGLERREIAGTRMAVNESGFAARVIRENRSLLVNDTSTEAMVNAHGQAQSWLGIPLIARNSQVALLTLQANQPNRFDSDLLRVVEGLGRQFALAIDNAMLYQRARREIEVRTRAQDTLNEERAMLAQRVEERTRALQRQYRWQAALAALEPSITRPHELQNILQQMVDVVVETVPADRGAWIVVPQQSPDSSSGPENSFDIAALAAKESEPHCSVIAARTSATATELLQSHNELLISDSSSDADTTKIWLRSLHVGALAAIPIVWQDSGKGVLFVTRADDKTWSAEQLDFLRALANRAAVALTNIELYAAQESANLEIARVSHLKDEFMAGMSHELRTPLNAVLGLSEALLEPIYGELNERQRRALTHIEQSGRHLLELINDILDFSKYEAGRLLLDSTRILLSELCEESVQLVMPVVVQKNISLRISVADEPAFVEADYRRLKQVLANLLSNAVKFTPEGGTVGLETRSTGASHFELSVWDTGIGIANDEIERLFEPFVQLESNLARRYNGTGLGLALVKRMVELHGGEVQVESMVGEGSRFTVRLPVRLGERSGVNDPESSDKLLLNLDPEQ